MALRQMGTQVAYAIQHITVIPDQFPWITENLTHGAPADYGCGIPRIPPIRGLPYHPSNADRFQYISQNSRNDIHAANLFVRPIDAITDAAPIEATPTTTVEKETRIGQSSSLDVLLPIYAWSTSTHRRINTIMCASQPMRRLFERPCRSTRNARHYP